MTSRALINPLPKNSGVSLRATIQNPRPRKYASDADRQKAFRERQALIQVRVAPKAVETFDEIAETLGYSRQEVVYALLMKGLMSLGNWETVGLPVDWQRKMPQFKLPRYEENPTMRKATPAQLAARERFAAMARSGAFKRKAKKNPAKKTVSQKISQLTREGYPQKQAVAIALSEQRAGKVKKNPISDIANIIYNQLGANRFAMMTGAKNFVAGDNFLMFSIGKNQSVFNKVRITLTPDDLYDVEFFKMNRLGDIAKTKKYEGMYAEQLTSLFTDVTGLYTSLGTMGRRSNPLGVSGGRYEIRRLDKSNAIDSVYTTLTHAKSAIDEIDRPAGSFYIVDTETGKHYFSFQAETKYPHIEIRGTAMQKAYGRNPADRERKPRVVLITNPQARTAKVKRSVNPNFQFAVQAQKRYPGNAVGYETVAGFPTKAQAQDYVNALLKAYPKGLTLRIMEGNA